MPIISVEIMKRIDERERCDNTMHVVIQDVIQNFTITLLKK